MSFVQREGITYLELTFWACGERACDKEIIKLEKFVITGGKPLHGEVIISGAKNAAVGILPATILAADVCVIENLPDISDVAVSLKILSVLGVLFNILSAVLNIFSFAALIPILQILFQVDGGIRANDYMEWDGTLGSIKEVATNNLY